jgi:hypothetical protein
VEYALATWSLSAHRICRGLSPSFLFSAALYLFFPFIFYSSRKLISVPEDSQTAGAAAAPVSSSTVKPLSTRKSQPQTQARLGEPPENPCHQWFWTGTHRDTKTLTPDLKYTVKRHIVVKRSLPVERFPLPTIQESKGTETLPQRINITVSDSTLEGNGAHHDPSSPIRAHKSEYKNQKKSAKIHGEDSGEGTCTLGSLFDFSFRAQVRTHTKTSRLYLAHRPIACSKVRVKKRFGRFHRILVLSSNDVKGNIVRPPFEQYFRLRAEANPEGIPKGDTHDINGLLN